MMDLSTSVSARSWSVAHIIHCNAGYACHFLAIDMAPGKSDDAHFLGAHRSLYFKA
jgi:hypothetical protein